MGRRFQYRLKTLFWLMLVIGVLSTFIPPAIRWYREYRERQRMEELRQLILDTVSPDT